MFTVPVNEIVDAAHSMEYAVKFLAGKTEAEQIYGLEFHPSFFEISFGFFCIKAFAFSEYLNIQ